MSELAVGTVIAGFRVESLLGKGAMARVYRAVEIDTDRVVALKVLGIGAQDERFRERFARETHVATSLDHPHVVRTLDSGEVDGRLYLAMELVAGSDLRQILREQGSFEPGRAVELVEQVAGALDAAHAAGLVHRDVKPGNILVAETQDGERAFVCDFGLARHVSSVTSLTGDRGFVGTIDYVPPEQIEGGPIDRRADVYSLACVLYECLAGSRPFARDSELSVVFAHLNEPPPRLTDTRPEVPEAFDEVFATALAKSPDERYSSCGELAAAARAALHGRVVAPRRSRRRLAVAAALVAAVAAAAMAFVFRPGHDGSPEPTISTTSIAGARIGDSRALLQRMWGGGRRLLTQTPSNYVVITQHTRNVSAYFPGTSDRAVEIVTWNKADRTAEGIGPCSSLADLRRVYGKRLRPSPNNTHGNLVFGWIVGKHLFFAMGPLEHPTTVLSVGIYTGDLGQASYLASNEGPCAPATAATPVNRPTHIPRIVLPKLTNELIAYPFRPRLTVHVPSTWRETLDTPHVFRVVSPDRVSIDFRLDPLASDAQGRPIRTVATTPTSLAGWLQKNPRVHATATTADFIGGQVFTTLYLGIDRPRGASATAIPYLTFARRGHPQPLTIADADHARVYLLPVRIGTLTHTLAIVVDAPSRRAFRSAIPTAEAIVKGMLLTADPGGILSAFSSLCTAPWRGTCLGEVPPGTYTTRTMHPAITYTVPLGWTNSGDNEGFFGLIPPGGDFNAEDTDRINVFSSVTTGNGRCADGHGTARTPEKFVEWLRGQPGLAPFVPRPVRFGSLSGVVVDLEIRKGYTGACPWSMGLPAQQVLTGLNPSPEQMNHALYPRPMAMRLYLLHYKQGTLAIEIDDMRGDSRMATYIRVVDSFRFSG